MNFDKYDFYQRAVQSPEQDVKFLLNTYRKHRGCRPQTLCEDFCGTFLLCCQWVQAGRRAQATGVDIDPQPLAYGMKHNFSQLTPAEQKRCRVLQKSVLARSQLKHDIIAAQNFSYYLFKTRAELKRYFKSCYNRLNSRGILMLDAFGGADCMTAVEEVTKHKDFVYYWDQDSFDPITNEAKFYIHFKPRRGRKKLRVFKYDWRMWTLPEVREILLEAGFKKTQVYWEGTDKNGEGNGIYRPAAKGEECEAWVAYVIGVK